MKKIINKNGGINYGCIETTYTTTCPHCFTYFSYQRQDVFIQNYGLGLPMVQCPSCGMPVSAAIGLDLSGGIQWKANSK